MTNEGQLLGEALATADEAMQAAVLNEFASALRACCKDRFGTQCFYIARNIRDTTAEMLREILGSYDYAKEDARGEVFQAKYDRLHELDRQIREKEAKLEEPPF